MSIFFRRLQEGGTEAAFAGARKDALAQQILEPADFNPVNVIAEARRLLDGFPSTEIIAGSIRAPLDIKQAGLAGAHIVTAGFATIQSSLMHFKTDEAVDRFLRDSAPFIARAPRKNRSPAN